MHSKVERDDNPRLVNPVSGVGARMTETSTYDGSLAVELGKAEESGGRVVENMQESYGEH